VRIRQQVGAGLSHNVAGQRNLHRIEKPQNAGIWYVARRQRALAGQASRTDVRNPSQFWHPIAADSGWQSWRHSSGA